MQTQDFDEIIQNVAPSGFMMRLFLLMNQPLNVALTEPFCRPIVAICNSGNFIG